MGEMRARTYVFLILIAVIGLMSLKGGVVSIVGFKSPSPENYGLLGSSEVPLVLSAEGYNVVLGGPYDVSPKSLYVIIAPEKAFSEVEDQAVASVVKRGADLIVADETGMANSLTKIFGIKISGIYVVANDTRGHGWEEVVRVSCRLGKEEISFITTRVSYIEKYPSWARPICWVEDPRVSKRYVYGVFGTYGKGRVLVLADSTLFANFLVKGIYPQLGSTREVVKRVVKFVAPGKRDVVIDKEHYNLIYVKLSSAPYLLMSLMAAGAKFLNGVILRARPYAAMIALVSAAGGLAFFTIGPPLREEPLRGSSDEVKVSQSVINVISKDLEFLGRTRKDNRLSVLALETSEFKPSSYGDLVRLVRRLKRRLGDFDWR